ncbi:MAG: GGDEF domain-containing phosphodiesterase [Lachnospiraceae bacterium]|nr:GGDEF domain-containing phosphodiesterase [Lachnospiraceae bacterium]
MIMTYNIVAFIILIYAIFTLSFHASYDKSLSKICYTLIVISIFDIVFDYLFIGTDFGQTEVLGKPIGYLCFYLFYISALVYPYFLLLFFAHFCRLNTKSKLMSVLPAALFLAILLIVNPVSHTMFDWQEQSMMRDMGSMMLTINGIIYMVSYIALLIYNFDVLGTRRGFVLVLVVVITIATYVLQGHFPKVMLINAGMSICLSISVLFFFYLDDTVDHQTGLQGKDGFFREARAVLNRDHTQRQYLMMRCNIRHLKDINEIYGSEIGAKLINAVARHIYGKTAEAGCCGRLGNNDFAYLLPVDLVEEEQDDWLVPIAEKLGIHAFHIDVVTGVYHITDRSKPIDLMCDRADYALASIKENYAVSYAYFSAQMEQEIADVRTFESEMYQAIKEKQFQVYYQPIFDLNTGEITSAEALVRWHHPTRGLIAPGKFISLFEKNGFISNLDEYVLQTVCNDINRWKDEGKKRYPISVNISKVEFNDVDHMMRMNEIFIKSGVDREMLHIEVTEGDFVMGDTNQMLSILENFHKSGVKVLMDDFGSGYSSLNRLRHMPVDVLKIDMRFLERGNDELDAARGRSILRYTVQMAQALNIPVVVEGVETEDQAEFLKSLHCESVQGFLYAKPMDVSKFDQLIENES